MKPKKWLRRGLKSAIAISIIGCLVGCTYFGSNGIYSESKLKVLDKYLRLSYLGEIDEDKIDQSIYAGYVDGLDNSKTYYLDQEAYERQVAKQEGKTISTGLSFQWTLDGNHLIITNVMKGSPAEEAGLKVGDKVTQIDDIKVISSNETLLYNKLANSDDEMNYTVETANGTKVVALKCKELELEELSSKLLEGVLYIKVQNIKGGTSTKVKQLLAENKSAKGLILDLRDLVSNELEEVLSLTDLLVKKQVAFKVKDKSGQMTAYETTDETSGLKTVLLMDSGTSGVIEGLIAAVKDQVTLVGSATAGKGYESKLISLEDGTGLNIATGILYNAKGEDLVQKGISPDLECNNGLESVIELLSTGQISPKNDLVLQTALKEFQ